MSTKNKVKIVITLEEKEADYYLHLLKIIKFVYSKNKKTVDIKSYNKASFLCGLDKFVNNILFTKEYPVWKYQKK